MTKRPTYSGAMPLAIGFLALALLVGGLGVWSVRTQISGAIIAPGMIVVENNRQVVQHPEGGIVGLIAARDGDRNAGHRDRPPSAELSPRRRGCPSR